MIEDRSNKIIESLKQRVKELEEENKRLKAGIEELRHGDKTVYSLRSQLSNSVDLGGITEKLPPIIPDHKKWKADDYPKEWEPEKKATDYLLTFWENYPVTQNYFNNVRGGQTFYKYLKRNNILKLLPNSFQLQLKKNIE